MHRGRKNISPARIFPRSVPLTGSQNKSQKLLGCRNGCCTPIRRYRTRTYTMQGARMHGKRPWRAGLGKAHAGKTRCCVLLHHGQARRAKGRDPMGTAAGPTGTCGHGHHGAGTVLAGVASHILVHGQLWSRCSYSAPLAAL